MAVRDERRGAFIQHKLFSEEIVSKEFGANDNEGHDAAQWKNREKDWYNAERRFIFATKTAKKRDAWIDQIVKDRVTTGLKDGMMAVIQANRAARGKPMASSSPASGTLTGRSKLTAQIHARTASNRQMLFDTNYLSPVNFSNAILQTQLVGQKRDSSPPKAHT